MTNPPTPPGSYPPPGAYPPPGGFPPPGTYPSPVMAAPPPPKKNHTLRTVLIVVGAVLAVCVAGGAVGGYILFRKVVDATQPERDAVHTFLGHLENGDLGGAYGDLCETTRDAYTQAEFTSYTTERARLASHEITGFNVSADNGVATATVTAQLHYTDGTSESHTFDLAKEHGEWHVCGDPY